MANFGLLIKTSTARKKEIEKCSILSQIFSEKQRKLIVRKGQEKQYLDDSLVFIYQDPEKILQATSAEEAMYLKLFPCYFCNEIANQLKRITQVK